jgi:hypothetical protein
VELQFLHELCNEFKGCRAECAFDPGSETAVTGCHTVGGANFALSLQSTDCVAPLARLSINFWQILNSDPPSIARFT